MSTVDLSTTWTLVYHHSVVANNALYRDTCSYDQKCIIVSIDFCFAETRHSVFCILFYRFETFSLCIVFVISC